MTQPGIARQSVAPPSFPPMTIKLGLPSLTLFSVFLVLKVTGTVTWSWWMVTCPLWAGLVAVIVILVGAFIGVTIGVTLGFILDYLDR